MADGTPIIDAARNAVLGTPHWSLSCDSDDLLNVRVAREIAVAALRAALPWPDDQRMPLVGPLMRELYPEKFR